MLTQTDAAVIRGAFSFWIDEIVPSGLNVAKHYLDQPVTEMPTAAETAELRSRFLWNRLLFVEADPVTKRIASEHLEAVGVAASRNGFVVIGRRR